MTKDIVKTVDDHATNKRGVSNIQNVNQYCKYNLRWENHWVRVARAWLQADVYAEINLGTMNKKYKWTAPDSMALR